MTTKIMIKSFLVNLSLTILKLLGSFFGNSKTLMADAIHCLSDMSTDIIGLIGSKLSKRESDNKHPYGHGKIEYLTSIIISVLIISLGLGILINSFNGNLKITNIYALIVLIISIIIKYILSSYLLKKGEELNSNILITNGTESRYDTYNSFLALIFITISLLGFKNKIFLYADIIGSIITSIITLKIGIKLLFENISSILGEKETNKEIINDINKVLKSINEIICIENITLLKYGSYYKLNMKVGLKETIKLKKMYKIENKIKNKIYNLKLNIKYINISYVPQKAHIN